MKESLRCPGCSNLLVLFWWDDIKRRIVKRRCPKCHKVWDYLILDVGGANYTISAVQN